MSIMKRQAYINCSACIGIIAIKWRDAGVVERARLESECVLNGAPRVRIPLSPPKYYIKLLIIKNK